MEETITIPLKRYNDLLESEAFLEALEAVGVDNWEGYSEAHKMLEDESKEE